MRVLHVLNGVSGGAARSVAELVEGMDGLGVTSFAICHDPRGVASAEREALERVFGDRLVYRDLYRWNRRIRARRVARPLMALHQLWRTGGGWASAGAVERQAREVGAEVIHTNTFTVPDGAVAARALGLPHVWHVRELIGPDQPFRFYGGRRGFRQVVDGSEFVVNSPATLSHFARLVPDASTHVVPNGLDLAPLLEVARHRGVAGASSDGVVVGMVANLTSTLKGHALFVDAAARCRDLPGVSFRLFGADPVQVGGTSRTVRYAQQIHRQVDDAGLAERFDFAGYGSDPVAMMRAVDVLVVPNETESFGRVAVEAMASGAAVVAVDCDALRFVLDDGRAGVLVAPRDAEALADALSGLVRDPQRRSALAQAGTERAVEAFSIERCAAAIVEIYRSATAAPRAPVPLRSAWTRTIPLRALGIGA